jgi:arylsulfatase A-like enzyme
LISGIRNQLQGHKLLPVDNNYIYCLILVCLTSACFNKQEENGPDGFSKPNIIYIIADDLGYGDLGCYGQTDIRTPNIDRIADEGMRFINHYAGNAVCAPSRCALMTGKHMGHAYIRKNMLIYPEDWKNLPAALPDREITVTELLKNAGYRTALIGKWELGRKNTPGYPLNKGFDLFVGYANSIRAHNSYPAWMWKNNDTLWLDNRILIMPVGYAKDMGGVAVEKNTHSNEVFMKEAYRFMNENRDTSFFLYLCLTIPHANPQAWYWDEIGIETPDMMGYDSVSSWPEVEKAYAAYVSYMDREIGKLMDNLKNLGIDKNTLVIFTSDNGPHDEGGADPAFFNKAGPLRGFKGDLYDGGIRIPFIARWPGKIEAGTTSDHISAFWDFLPTACELAGIEPPVNTDGISYLPELLGKEQEKHDYLYWEYLHWDGNERQAVRMEEWKMVRYDTLIDSETRVELYDLSEDIGETTDVADQHPRIVEEMLGIMEDAHEKSELETAQFGFEKQNQR